MPQDGRVRGALGRYGPVLADGVGVAVDGRLRNAGGGLEPHGVRSLKSEGPDPRTGPRLRQAFRTRPSQLLANGRVGHRALDRHGVLRAGFWGRILSESGLPIRPCARRGRTHVLDPPPVSDFPYEIPSCAGPSAPPRNLRAVRVRPDFGTPFRSAFSFAPTEERAAAPARARPGDPRGVVAEAGRRRTGRRFICACSA